MSPLYHCWAVAVELYFLPPPRGSSSVPIQKTSRWRRPATLRGVGGTQAVSCLFRSWLGAQRGLRPSGLLESPLGCCARAACQDARDAAQAGPAFILALAHFSAVPLRPRATFTMDPSRVPNGEPCSSGEPDHPSGVPSRSGLAPLSLHAGDLVPPASSAMMDVCSPLLSLSLPSPRVTGFSELAQERPSFAPSMAPSPTLGGGMQSPIAPGASGSWGSWSPGAGMESPTWPVPLPAENTWGVPSPGVLDAVTTAASRAGAGESAAVASSAVGDKEPSLSLRLRPMDTSAGGLGGGGGGWGGLVAGGAGTSGNAARGGLDGLCASIGGVGATWAARSQDGNGDPGATMVASMGGVPVTSSGRHVLHDVTRPPVSSSLQSQSGLSGGFSSEALRWGGVPATSAGHRVPHHATRPPASSTSQPQSGLGGGVSSKTLDWAPTIASGGEASHQTRPTVAPVEAVNDLSNFPSSSGSRGVVSDCGGGRPPLPVVRSPTPVTFSTPGGVPFQPYAFFQPNPVVTSSPESGERSPSPPGGRESLSDATTLWSSLGPTGPGRGVPLGAPPPSWSPLISGLAEAAASSLNTGDRAFAAVDFGGSGTGPLVGAGEPAEDRDDSSGQDGSDLLPAVMGAPQPGGGGDAPSSGDAPPLHGGSGAPPRSGAAPPPGGGSSSSSDPAPVAGGAEAAMARVVAVVEATATAAANEWRTANFARLNPPPPPPVAARLSNRKAAFVSRASRRARSWALTQELTAAAGPAAVAAVDAAARRAGEAARDEWKAAHREEREAARAQVRVASDEVAYAPVVVPGECAAGDGDGAAVARLQAARNAVRNLANKASAAGQRAAHAAQLDGLELALWRAYGQGEGRSAS